MVMFIVVLGALSGCTVSDSNSDNISFFDDFERSLAKWDLNAAHKIDVIDSGDPRFGNVLSLTPGHPRIYALVRGSEDWDNYQIEADMMFPEDGHSYMGLIYHYNETAERTDFGSIYIKGNGSYIRVNPRRDHNAHRTLYEEYKTPLTGQAAVEIGVWQHFKAEVMDSVCHFYVGDMTTPQVTFDALELHSGRVGFKPRVVGAPLRLDNVRVSSISQFSYSGPPKPGVQYDPQELITNWQVIGPFHGPVVEIEEEGHFEEKTYDEAGKKYRWTDFTTDKRGCVVSGRVTQFLGNLSVAYFHTTLVSEKARVVNLQTSTREELAFWLNGEFLGYDSPDRYAWYDFWKNEEHRGSGGTVSLRPGANSLLVRVRGGKYAAGGFYLRVGEAELSSEK
jgi:hypothetical protein